MKVRMSKGLWIVLIYKESLFFPIVGSSNGREIWNLGIGKTTVQVFVGRIKCQKHN
jgi:hypothetical protein